MVKKILPFIIIIFLSFPAIRPLFSGGYFPMHDDTQPTRVYQMYQALKDGQFPVRWVSDLGYGYGYPIFNFYAPFPYYFGALGMLVGHDAVHAAKIMFGIGILLSGVFMYLLGRRLWGRLGGILAATLYVYFPYHAVQIYVRGAVGEYWAYAFLPLLFLGIHKIYRSKISEMTGILIGAVAFSLIILSHNITGFLIAGFLAVLGIVEIGRGLLTSVKKTKVVAVVSILGLGLSLSAFFWLPAVTELKYSRAHILIEGNNDFREHFVFLDQLWDSPWGYAGSSPGRTDGISFKIGKLHLLIGLLGLLSILLSAKRATQSKGITLCLFAGAVFSVIMMLSLSKPIWETIPIFAYIQYPWRFLVFTGFCVSLIGGGLLFSVTNKKWKIASTFVLSFLVIYINAKNFVPQFISPLNVDAYTSERSVKWQISKISDEYLPRGFYIPQNETKIAWTKFETNGDIIVESSEVKSNNIKLNVSAQNEAEIAFFVADFPGWHAVVDTKVVIPHIFGRGLIVPVSEGRHVVSLIFTDTKSRILGNLISILGILVALFMYQSRARDIR